MAAPVLPMMAAAAAAPAIAFTLRWFLSSASTSAAASEAFFCAATRIAPRDLLAERRTRRPAWKEREEEESNAGQRCPESFHRECRARNAWVRIPCRLTAAAEACRARLLSQALHAAGSGDKAKRRVGSGVVRTTSAAGAGTAVEVAAEYMLAPIQARTRALVCAEMQTRDRCRRVQRRHGHRDPRTKPQIL